MRRNEKRRRKSLIRWLALSRDEQSCRLLNAARYFAEEGNDFLAAHFARYAADPSIYNPTAPLPVKGAALVAEGINK